MKKILLLISFSSFALNVFACVCWFSTEKKFVKDIIAKADVILYARVIPDSLSANFQQGDSSLHVTEVLFQVIKIWKGEASMIARFKAKRYPCGDAGYNVGERYIIFAYRNQTTGELETNDCRSLSEQTIPDPKDKYLMRSKNFNAEGFRKEKLRMRREFESVKALITRKTK